MQTRFFGFAIRHWSSLRFSGASGIVLAQSIQHGKISGRILDESGQPIPGVKVEITSPALISGTRTTTSAASGTYIFLSLPIGTYKVTASLTGI